MAGCSSNADGRAAATASRAGERTVQAPRPPAASDVLEVDVPEGTVIEAKLDRTLDSSCTHAGETFTATVYVDVVVDGRRAIPAGSTLHGIVKGAVSARRGARAASLALAFNSIELPDENSVAMVASFDGPAGNGSSREAAVLGGAAGVGEGTGVVTGRGGEQVRLSAGSSLALRLVQPVQVPRRT